MKIQLTLKTLLVMLVSFCSQTVWGQGVTDVLTSDSLAATGTSYTKFKDVTLSSGAVYAGQTARSRKNAIQMRTSSNSGIVTTSSGGTLTLIKVTWNSSTENDRELLVYGKKEAYRSIDDLYSTKTIGIFGLTKL